MGISIKLFPEFVNNLSGLKLIIPYFELIPDPLNSLWVDLNNIV